MRKARLIQPGASYHITARANHKEKYLRSRLAKDLFVETLANMRKNNDCRVIDFVVMENHIHLIIEPRGESTLGNSMKWLFGVYTMRYNRAFKAWGTVWGSRFFSRPINGIGDMAATIAYIDNNPVRSFLAERPEDWVWGGLFAHRSGRDDVIGPPPLWLAMVAPEHGRRGLSP